MRSFVILLKCNSRKKKRSKKSDKKENKKNAIILVEIIEDSYHKLNL